MQQNLGNEVELAAIKSIAAASKTPFRTAFKATLGVAVAQLVVAAVFFGILGLGGLLLYVLVRN